MSVDTNDPERNAATDSCSQFRKELEEYPLFEFLDVGVEFVEPGRVALAMPFRKRLVNVTGKDIHGGVTATIIDTASGMALRSTFDDPAEVRMTTTDMNIRYVRPARGDLRVEAEVVRAGLSMGVTDADVTTLHEGERTIVATGGTTYRLFRDNQEDHD